MTRTERAVQRHPVAAALLGYVVLALAATWPLPSRLARDLPSDLGDPLLNCWILAWVCHQVFRAARGDFGALSALWDANIFHPEPLALAYSEHLIPQALQIAPIYALTGNIVVAYNVLYLATFVLSGLGAFLLVRDLTQSPPAAFVAGMLFAFSPYRADQMPHLQVLSSQWMPFVLLTARRYLDAGSPRVLAASALLLLVQNLSCGYYIFYFAPFAFAYGVTRWGFGASGPRCRRLLAGWAAAMAATAAIIHPYWIVRRQGLILRSLEEVQSFSADVLSFLTATPSLSLWGPVLRFFERAEGATFPGLTVAAMATWAVGAAARQGFRTATAGRAWPAERRRLVLFGATVFTLGLAVAFAVSMSRRGHVLELGIFDLRLLGPTRPLLIALAGAGLALAASARVRAGVRGLLPFEVGFHAFAAATAAWLALGPTITVGGWPTDGLALYRLPYELVPGFDGVRAPSRLAMPMSLFLAVLGGFALQALHRARQTGWIVVAGALAFVEAAALPHRLAGEIGVESYNSPRWTSGPRAIDQDLAALPDEAVLIELPFGLPGYETQYMHASTHHWRRLVNGTSGDFPPSYAENRYTLRDPLRYPDLVLATARRTRATHLVVHESAWKRGKGPKVAERLVELGAVKVVSRDGATLLAVPRSDVAP